MKPGYLIGNQLEESGWRQGSIVRTNDLKSLLNKINIEYEEGVSLFIASQSCDIANNNIESDPYIELSLARCIDAPNGNLTYNKNPRVLHTNTLNRTRDEIIVTKEHFELKAYEKICIPKDYFLTLTPDQDRMLEDRFLESYISWLAARYSRPALPTAFNDLIRASDPRDKLKGKAKKGNEQLAGIYVEIIPDREISPDESYEVNLLGLLPAGYDGDTSIAKNTINAYVDVLCEAGMSVTSFILKEDEVTIATIKRFKRFYYDDLSLRNESPLPPEIKTIL